MHESKRSDMSSRINVPHVYQWRRISFTLKKKKRTFGIFHWHASTYGEFFPTGNVIKSIYYQCITCKQLWIFHANYFLRMKDGETAVIIKLCLLIKLISRYWWTQIYSEYHSAELNKVTSSTEETRVTCRTRWKKMRKQLLRDCCRIKYAVRSLISHQVLYPR